MSCSFKANTLNNEANQKPEESTPTRVTRGRPHWVSDYDSFTQAWTADWQKCSTRRNVGGTQKCKWTPEEDLILKNFVETHGTRWSLIQSFLPNRTGKQCRERWMNYFAPGLSKNDWTSEEDLFLLKRQSEVGNKWSLISQQLPGRSSSAVKNRWNWLLRRGIPTHLTEFQNIISQKGNGSVSTTKEAPKFSSFFEKDLYVDVGDVDFNDFLNLETFQFY
ncbi:Myb-like DNA-binding domain containing protein [Histomonas meleagridis]|uniref:Myb-like DNA-binding domain containing protein n=1 Tax=Histomonas meleagridis TaxID=135588 RepID=UPI00355A2228|nr:Myb-like DNA-binding domain containing protein [Histomonas meleagridis]KAH0803476.1 Myb-like DNA-binding domain containing protein [Histomonas meleagridis]